MSGVYYIVTGIKFPLRPKKDMAVRMGQWMSHTDTATKLLSLLPLPRSRLSVHALISAAFVCFNLSAKFHTSTQPFCDVNVMQLFNIKAKSSTSS